MLSPDATFTSLNAHFHQLENHCSTYTLNFFSLCNNAALNATQLLKISYVVALIQTKLPIAQSNSHAHFF